jgi:hypothetical protein
MTSLKLGQETEGKHRKCELRKVMSGKKKVRMPYLRHSQENSWLDWNRTGGEGRQLLSAIAGKDSSWFKREKGPRPEEAASRSDQRVRGKTGAALPVWSV